MESAPSAGESVSKTPIYDDLVGNHGDPFARLPHDEEAEPLTQPLPAITKTDLDASVARHPAGSRRQQRGRTGEVSGIS